MRPVKRIHRLHDILKPENLTSVVDIGANPFAGSPPYGTLRRSDRCEVIGFEPLPEAFDVLTKLARHNDRFLPYAVGRGGPLKLYVTKNSGLVSTLPPLPDIGKLLGPWWERAVEVKDVLDIETYALDDIEDVQRIDFLKIDIQGGELEVFQNAQQKLCGCAAIQTEICLHPYYEGQPTFGDIQVELSKQGFIAHKFVEMSAHPMAHSVDLPKGMTVKPSQATVADMIFIKDPTDMKNMETELLKQMALLSFAIFRSFDLTLRCLSELRDRAEVSEDEVIEAVRIIGLA